MTRSSTVSSSSARGSVLTVASTFGNRAPTAPSTRAVIAATRSSGSVRLTATTRSTNSTSPAGRARTRSTATTPGTRAAAARILSAAPAGAVSVSVSMVRRPSRQPATQMNTATTTAAAESAHGYPSATAPRPPSTAIDDHMSEPKCRASASSASLEVSAATR